MSSNRPREAAKPIYWSIVMMGLMFWGVFLAIGTYEHRLAEIAAIAGEQ